MAEKSQLVRLFDVFFIGPFLLWIALKTRQQTSDTEYAAILFIAITTILYNGYNYLANIFRLPPLPL